MKRLIVYLIRKRLGLKKFEYFRFTNQKSKSVYWIANTQILKMEAVGSSQVITLSNVSLNWLLDNNCRVQHIPASEVTNYL